MSCMQITFQMQQRSANGNSSSGSSGGTQYDIYVLTGADLVDLAALGAFVDLAPYISADINRVRRTCLAARAVNQVYYGS